MSLHPRVPGDVATHYELYACAVKGSILNHIASGAMHETVHVDEDTYIKVKASHLRPEDLRIGVTGTVLNGIYKDKRVYFIIQDPQYYRNHENFKYYKFVTKETVDNALTYKPEVEIDAEHF